MKLSGLLLGFLLASTLAFAAQGSCGAGKCGAEMKKEMKCACNMKDKKDNKCTCENKEKCTCDMKKEMKGSCGAGKCGAEMKKEMKDEMKDTKKEMKDEMKGSCGTGKCGSK